VYLSTKEARTSYQVFSICTSILTTAFTTTATSFDWDVNPDKRTHSPDFYGMIPDGNKPRLKIFALMFLVSIAHVTSTSMGMATLIVVSPISAWLYALASTCVYLLYRLWRGDMHYWLPAEGTKGWAISVLERILVKLGVDFTGFFQMRHPFELGGLYYTGTMIQSQVASVVFAVLYTSEKGEDALNAIYWLVASACVVWTCSYALFLASIEQGYMHTFIDTRSAIDYTVDKFNDPNSSDYEKTLVSAGNTRIYWHSIESDVCAFFADNWDMWELEQPSWFTPGYISTFPLDLLPSEVAAEEASSRASRPTRPTFARLN